MSTTEIAPYAGGQAEEYGARLLMTPEDAKALDDRLTQCIRAILHEGTDYGHIPGTSGDEKALYRPGAQKLLLWFGLGFTCDRIDVERDDEGRKHGITYRAVVGRRLPDGSIDVKATCEGTADYDESKFFKSAEQVQREAEDRERQFAEKDHRPPRPTRWQGLSEYRAPWNTVIKRAQKRAIVGATLDATAAGGRFNTEREEDDHAPAPADDGPSWYEQAIEAALTFTDVEDGRTLYVDAAQAHRDGHCTRRQQDHVQNTITQRVKLLKTATPVDVEDLGTQAARLVSGGVTVKAGKDEPADEPSPHAEMRQHFTRLGFGDSDEDTAARIRHIARITGRTVTPGKPLTDAEAQHVADELARCKDWDALDALLNDGEKPGGDDGER